MRKSFQLKLDYDYFLKLQAKNTGSFLAFIKIFYDQGII